MKVIKLVAQCIVFIGGLITLIVLSPWFVYMAADAYLEREEKKREELHDR